MGVFKRLPHDYIELALLSIALLLFTRVIYISSIKNRLSQINSFFKILLISYILSYITWIICKLIVLFVRDKLTIYWSLVESYYILYYFSLNICCLIVYGRLRFTFIGIYQLIVSEIFFINCFCF